MLRKRIVTFLWSGAVAFVIVLVGQDVWGILLAANLKATPSLPWAVPVMAIVAYAANPVWASVPAHALAYLVAFTLRWPRSTWFWIHAAQALIFTVIIAF